MEFPTLRYILGFLGFIALIIFLIVFIVRIGNRSGTELDLAPVPELVESVDAGDTFMFTEDGPIVADEDHYSIRITVNRNGRRVEVIRGYENNVVAQQNFGNNDEAFRSFLSALDRAGYTTERLTRLDSEAGVCPTGRRYVFESGQNGSQFRRWSSSCREKGDFGGMLGTTLTLYRKQIPGYDQFIRDTRQATGLVM